MHDTLADPTRPPEFGPAGGWLAAILGDMSIAVFERQYFDRAMTLLPGDRGRFTELLTWPSLNRLLETAAFTRDTLRMAMGGSYLPVSDYLVERTVPSHAGPVSQLKARGVTEHLRRGATLIVNNIGALSHPIRALQEDLQRGLDANVSVNMYASLCETNGFPCHYDSHDVLILQVHGSKRWQLFGQRTLPPVLDDTNSSKEEPPCAEPTWDQVLQQGDALYLPRGCWHLAIPIGEPTVHLTVAVVRPNGLDYVAWLTRSLRREVLLRRALPRSNSSEADAYERSVRELIIACASKPGALELFRRDLVRVAAAVRTAPRFGLPWSAMNEVLPPLQNDNYIYLMSPNGLSIDVLAAAGATGTESENAERRDLGRDLCDYLNNAAPVRLELFVKHFAKNVDEGTLLDFLKDLASKGLIAVRS